MGNPVVHFEIMSNNDQLPKFYEELFGWHVERAPEMNYAMIDTHAGGINGGIGTAPDRTEMTLIYVEVPDLQKTLDEAVQLGGSLAMPIIEMGPVTMAHFTDPQGNRLGIVKSDPSQPSRTGASGGSNPVNWFEILGSDGPALRKFYGKLFGWKIEPTPADGIDYGQTEAGIGGGIGETPMKQPAVQFYAEVDDIQKYLDRAESLGGKTIMPPTDLGNVSFAQFADPGGLTFGLWKNNS
jgi:predicted enzyme related to lactoylglutathione lyase